MNGVVFNGEEGQISRNDGLFITISYLCGMNGSRNKHEDSTSFQTRSVCTLIKNGIPIVNIEEKDECIKMRLKI